jgi:S1-C subfamily serine protease
LKKTILVFMLMATMVVNICASVREVARRIAPSVVEIYVQPANTAQFRSIGTGWIYGSQVLVVTANHVVLEEIQPVEAQQAILQSPITKPYERIKVRFMDNNFADVVSVKSSLSVDLALLVLDAQQVKGKKRPLLEIASSDPAIGDMVIGMGYPFEYPGPVLFVGYVNQHIQSIYTGMTATICPGHSGSVVVNDKGKVVGIALSIDRRSSSLNFFLPRSILVKELKSLMSL